MSISEETPLTERQSLDLIQQMIRQARADFGDNSFDYLLWGWLIFAAALTHFGLLQTPYAKPWLPWSFLMPLGALLSVLHHVKKRQTEAARSPISEWMAYLWIGFGVTLLFVLFSMSRLGYHNTYPLVLALYGLGTFVSGGALRFRPLILGGIGCWLLAAVALVVGFSTQLLLIAAAVLLSFIVPGYLLKARFRRATRPV